MFEHREFVAYSGTVKDQFYLSACNYWASQGFSVTRVSPYRIQGETYDSKIGLKRNFVLTINEESGNTYLDLQMKASVTDLGIVGGVVAAAICWPIALIGGAWSYSEYESDVKSMGGNFWHYMSQIAHGAGGTNGTPAHGGN